MKGGWFILLFLPLCSGAADALRHDLYLCLSQSQPVIVGAKVPSLNGVFRLDQPERNRPIHLGFNHPRVDSLAVDPRNLQRIYLVGSNGVMGTDDGGLRWKTLTGWELTEPKDIAIDPGQPDTIYLGLPDGIAVSRDRGATWQRANAGIARAYTQSILVDRTRVGRLLAGTELGIYLSEDGAATWRRVFTSTKTVNDVRQSPHDPQMFLAATQANGAVLSRDGGLTWQQLSGSGAEHTLHNIDFDPTDAWRLYASSWGGGILVSEDEGRTWLERGAGLPNRQIWRVAADPDLRGRLYASPHQQAVFASDDFGRSWRPLGFEAVTVWDFVFALRAEKSSDFPP